MSFNKKTTLFLSLAILVLFLAPDLLYWVTIDHFKTPLRHILGDTALYVYQLNSVIRGNGPAANPYFIENQYQLGRFFVFGKLLLVIPFKDKIPIIWWTIILRGAVPLFVFFILAAILRQFGTRRFLSYLFSFVFVLFYGPMTFKGGIGLTNWFLPLILFGFWGALKFYKGGEINIKSFLLSLASLLFFSLHPVAFSVGAAFLGILWLILLRRKFNGKALVYFLIWLASAILLFAWVFLPFLYSRDANFSVIAGDMSFRNTLLLTRFPFLFLFGVRFLLLALISAYCYFKTRLDGAWKTGCFLILILSLIAFLGLNSYVITGKYFLNDHYPFLEDFMVMPLALMIIFGPRTESKKMSKYLGLAVLIFAVISILVVLNASNFKPNYHGRWVPLFASYFAIGLIFFKPKLKENLFVRRGKFLLGLLLALSVLHIIFISYWDDAKYWLPLHKETQKYRGFVEELSKLPRGVILANPYVSNLALVYTGHKVYCSPIALHDAVSTRELYDRWIRARVFFPEEPVFNGKAAIRSIFGLRNNKCREFKRYIYLDALSRMGIKGPKEALCDESIYETWPQEKIIADEFLSEIESGGKKWEPIYRVDYLIVEKNKDKVSSELIGRYFAKIDEDEKFVVYSYKY
jgi:hypothetical protein